MERSFLWILDVNVRVQFAAVVSAAITMLALVAIRFVAKATAGPKSAPVEREDSNGEDVPVSIYKLTKEDLQPPRSVLGDPLRGVHLGATPNKGGVVS